MKRLFVFVLIVCTASVFGGDWQQWRGPDFNGGSDEKSLPGVWKADDVAWSVDLPGHSAGTPIICDGKVFVSSSDKQSKDLLGLCFDEKTGKPIWKKKISTGDHNIDRDGNMAAASPVTDGERVYFTYENGFIAALDFKGEVVWTRDLAKEYGSTSLKFGYSSTPLAYEDKLYVQVLRRPNLAKGEDGKPTDSYILALDSKTGKNIFKQKRHFEVLDETYEVYSSPIPFEHKGRKEVVIIGADWVTSHDPENGKELWRYKYMLEPINWGRHIPSLVTGEGLLFGVRSRGVGLFAVKAGAMAEVPETDIAWTFDGPTPDVCTPLFYKGYVYVLDGKQKKMVTKLDAKTGQVKWKGRLETGELYASLTAGDDKIYCIDEKGVVIVLDATADEMKILCKVDLDSKYSRSSIAIANRSLFIRTGDKLYCVRKEK